MIKFVMKNEKTKQYWTSDHYPQITSDVWQASKFDLASQAQSSLNALMPEKYHPRDFKPTKITITEEGAED